MPTVAGSKYVYRVDVDDAEILALKRSQPIRRVIRSEAMKVLWRARARAPMSETGSDGRPPGYLRAQIKMFMNETPDGPEGVVKTTAKSARGFRYGAYWQRRRPYIRAGTSL